MDTARPQLRVLPTPARRASARLRDVVRDTEQAIAEGGEGQRPVHRMVEYGDIKAAYDVLEMLADTMEDNGCLHAIAGSHIGSRIREVMRGG